MNKIYGIYYDLDNTLYPQIEDVRQRIDYCIDKFSLKEGKKIKVCWEGEWLDGGPQKRDVIEKIIERFGLDLRKEKLINSYRSCKTRLCLADDVAVLLKRLRDRGIKQFIITNGNKSAQSNKIDSLKLRHYFDEIIISEEENAKPSAYWFEKTMERYCLRPEDCISVGDWFAVDGLASQRAGIRFIYKKGGPIKEDVPDHIDKIVKLVQIEVYI